jgi:phage shock protein PspC (stress-responsive transcriptional regulator)
VIAGIAGGLGQYFGIDSVIVRVIFVLLALTHGFGLVLYLILWIVIPEEPHGAEAHASDKVKEFAHSVEKAAEHVAGKIEEKKKEKGSAKWVIGFLMVLVGAFALAQQFFPMGLLRWSVFWPTLLILAGLYVMIKKDKGQ